MLALENLRGKWGVWSLIRPTLDTKHESWVEVQLLGSDSEPAQDADSFLETCMTACLKVTRYEEGCRWLLISVECCRTIIPKFGHLSRAEKLTFGCWSRDISNSGMDNIEGIDGCHIGTKTGKYFDSIFDITVFCYPNICLPIKSMDNWLNTEIYFGTRQKQIIIILVGRIILYF